MSRHLVFLGRRAGAARSGAGRDHPGGARAARIGAPAGRGAARSDQVQRRLAPPAELRDKSERLSLAPAVLPRVGKEVEVFGCGFLDVGTGRWRWRLAVATTAPALGYEGSTTLAGLTEQAAHAARDCIAGSSSALRCRWVSSNRCGWTRRTLSDRSGSQPVCAAERARCGSRVMRRRCSRARGGQSLSRAAAACTGLAGGGSGAGNPSSAAGSSPLRGWKERREGCGASGV
jgi:hypothetical protein